MKHLFLTEIRRHPWAVLPDYLPTIARVISRLESGDGLSADDARSIEAGKLHWEARRAQSSAYAGGTVAVIGIYGVMTQRGEMMDMSTPTASMARIGAAVQQAAADPSIGAIVLDVDSPGGSVWGTQELADAIYDARSAKPVVAVANSLAASAAYWTASQASELYAAPGAQVGSIGVYATHIDQSEAMKQCGINVELISAGKYKTEGNSYGPLDDEARANMQSMVDGYYDAFIRGVARGRGASLKAVKDGMGQGRCLMAADAQAAGMIDGVATLGQVVAKVQAKLRRGGSLAMAKNQFALLD